MLCGSGRDYKGTEKRCPMPKEKSLGPTPSGSKIVLRREDNGGLTVELTEKAGAAPVKVELNENGGLNLLAMVQELMS